MKIGMVGLGKMGANMVTRLLKGGHSVVVSDLNQDAIDASVAEGAIAATSLANLVEQLPTPRVVWVMVPSGKATEFVTHSLTDLLSPTDIIVDGGNNNYKETTARATRAATKEVEYVDVGTSGGVWGLTGGYSMMVGGTKTAVAHITPILETLAPATDKGWGHVGPSGAGHFVKMVHNGIEYGLMQAYAEGFEIMEQKPEYDLNLHQISQIWQHGSVVRSWLLDLTERALADDSQLSDLQPWVNDSGMGRWTVTEAVDLAVPAPVITAALQSRFFSRSENSFAHRLLAAMRNQFGGHAVKKS